MNNSSRKAERRDHPAGLLPMHLCLLPPIEVRARLLEHASRWAHLPPGSLTKSWRLHLTMLAGLGADPGTRLADWTVLEQRLTQSLGKLRLKPMQIELNHAMVWHGNKAVIVAEDNFGLRRLRDMLLSSALGSGMKPLHAMTTPHITLSRHATPASRPPEFFEPIRWMVTDVALVRSTPYPAWYELVGRYGRCGRCGRCGR